MFQHTPHRRSLFTPLRGAAVVAVLAAAALTGCSAGEPGADASSSASASPSAARTTAAAAPKPKANGCHALTYQQALAPTSTTPEVPCGKPHTAETYAVGELETVVDGHLLAVDSDYVQQQPAKRCTPALRKHLGGSVEDLRLSTLRAVWFTPTLEESDAGAAWYRCDVIAVAGPEKLAVLDTPTKGLLRGERAEDFALCSLGEPGSRAFTAVPCRNGKATWKAISTIPFEGTAYPGQARVKAAGDPACRDAALESAADPLDYEWGYQWPTKEDWEHGQTYGLCWTPVG